MDILICTVRVRPRSAAPQSRFRTISSASPCRVVAARRLRDGYPIPPTTVSTPSHSIVPPRSGPECPEALSRAGAVVERPAVLSGTVVVGSFGGAGVDAATMARGPAGLDPTQRLAEALTRRTTLCSGSDFRFPSPRPHKNGAPRRRGALDALEPELGADTVSTGCHCARRAAHRFGNPIIYACGSACAFPHEARPTVGNHAGLDCGRGAPSLRA